MKERLPKTNPFWREKSFIKLNLEQGLPVVEKLARSNEFFALIKTHLSDKEFDSLIEGELDVFEGQYKAFKLACAEMNSSIGNIDFNEEKHWSVPKNDFVQLIDVMHDNKEYIPAMVVYLSKPGNWIYDGVNAKILADLMYQQKIGKLPQQTKAPITQHRQGTAFSQTSMSGHGNYRRNHSTNARRSGIQGTLKAAQRTGNSMRSSSCYNRSIRPIVKNRDWGL